MLKTSLKVFMPTSQIKQPNSQQGTHQTAVLYKPFPGMLEGVCESQQLDFIISIGVEMFLQLKKK